MQLTPEHGIKGMRSFPSMTCCAGPEVSAAVGSDGRAWLWGFGTNSQLGNGGDDSDKEIPSLLKGKALQGKRVVQACHPGTSRFASGCCVLAD